MMVAFREHFFYIAYKRWVCCCAARAPEGERTVFRVKLGPVSRYIEVEASGRLALPDFGEDVTNGCRKIT